MPLLQTATATLPVPADVLYAFLADLSKHRTFLEPGALDFEGDADRHSYALEIMGMKMPQEMAVKARVPGQRVVMVPGGRKLFEHELTFEIGADGAGCTLQLRDQAEIPMMMAMMGAEKLLQAQLDSALARIGALAAAGALA